MDIEKEFEKIERYLGLDSKPVIAKAMRETAQANDVELYIDHHLLHCYRALKQNSFDFRVAELYQAATEARDALESKNANWLCIAMFKLGEVAGRMNLPSELEVKKTRIAELKRTIGLQIHNSEKAWLKQIAQAFAEDFWQKDVQNKIRVSEMTDEVYSKIHAVFGSNPIIDYLPEKEAFKDWIREVAPDYAKKGGRPAKAKK